MADVLVRYFAAAAEVAGREEETFAVDLTEARSRCASCGNTAMLGAHHLGGH